jgi:amidase
MDGWDAVETAERIRRREVSAREVMAAAIGRAEAAGTLGAIVTETFEQAMDGCGAARGPLAGVPYLVKDLVRVKGVRTRWGTRAVGHVVPGRSDPIMRVLAATGMVSLGKSATPELGLTATTEPLGEPPCRNPWDPARSAGGSSGGAAALVAAGVVPIAHASDGGGSIRIPASSTGLVGLKPTRGRLDMEGSNLLPVNVAVHGVVTRSVRDTVAFFRAVERVTRPRRPIGEARAVPGRRLRILAFTDSPLGRRVDPEVQAAVHDAARLCASLGHEVRLSGCPFGERVILDFLRYWSFLAWLYDRFGRLLVHRGMDRKQLEPWTRGLADWCHREQRPTWAAIARLRAFGRTYAGVMERADVLLSPTLAHPPPPLGHLATDVPFDEKRERLFDHCPFTPAINAAGAPAITLPLGRSAEGLPIGIQLAARVGDDRTLLELAGELEQAEPWPRTAPARNLPGRT